VSVPPLTVYTTVYTTIYRHVVTLLVSNYRIVSEIVTELTVDYYDPDTGELYTTISYPTNYLKTVYTVLHSVETRIYTEVVSPRAQQPAPPRGPPREVPPVPERTERAGVRVAT
jgi:hypothetical protein